MIRLAAVSGALLAMSAPGALASSNPSDAGQCLAVADAARRLPSEDWTKGIEALQPTLLIEKPWSSSPAGGPPPNSLMTMVAAAPEVRKVVGDGQSWTIFVEHVPGTDLYDAYSLQGTLHCQSDILVRARQGELPSVVANPPTYKGGLCWTQSGDLGEVNRRPVFITHGATDPTAFDQDLQITPYRNGTWGTPCRVSLTFRTTYKIASRFCADPLACKLGDGIAVSVASRFGEDANHGKEVEHFSLGPPPSPELASEVAKLMDDKGPSTTPEFPTFGAKDDPGPPWSYSDFQFFPLTLDGRPYVGAIGHEGVGCRAGDTTLLAVYEPHGKTLKALASFVLVRSVSGLKAASLKPAVVESGP